ncbi:MAG: FAD-binding oxidoreductase [Bacteroidota bacterium]
MIIKTDPEIIVSYLQDASHFKGNADKVYIPETIEEIVEIMTDSFLKNIPVTISGAGTGLTGSRVPLSGNIISTEKLNNIIEINENEKYAIVQPAVLYNEFESLLTPLGLFYAPNPTEKNSSLGGNVATNASGAKTFKYGATRSHVLGLKIVLADGSEVELVRGKNFADNFHLTLMTKNHDKIEILLPNLSMPDIKHAAGYFIKPGMDAIDLFIGSEGTLGIITEIKLKLLKSPEKVIGIISFFENETSLLDYVESVRDLSKINNLIDYKINTQISTRLIEFFDKYSLNLLREDFPQIPESTYGAIWCEQEYSLENESIILEEWYNKISKYTALSDSTWIALTDSEHEKFRDFRHALPSKIVEINERNNQNKIGTDTAVPDRHFREYFRFLQNEYQKINLPFVTYGHIGNSHLHANIFVTNDFEYQKGLDYYSKCIAEALRLKGTISAEHGVGKLKKKYLEQMFGVHGISAMKNLKRILDPKFLLGRGTMFD